MSGDDLIKMEREQRDGLVIVRLGGEIDLANVNALQSRLERAAYGFDKVVVDLGAVEYIDSQGLRLLQPETPRSSSSLPQTASPAMSST